MSTPSFHAADLLDVKGLVAVITGGGSGLGLNAALALDANGAAAVYIVGRRKETLENAAKQAVNGKIIPIVGDVSSKESLKAVAKQVRSERGFINVLFANSGVAGPLVKDYVSQEKPTAKEYADGLLNSNMEDYTSAMGVNVTGVLFTALAFLELLDEGNKKGNVTQKSQVIVTASLAGYSRLVTTGWAYSASKAAAIHITMEMATIFAPWKIRANALAPGFFPSEMTARLADGEDMSVEGAVPNEKVPLARWGSREDFAGTMLWLTSKAGSYIDGNVLVIDGGRLSVLPSRY